jgi:hypothetical protein
LELEGLTDQLAAVSKGLPTGWVAITSTSGAKARGNLPRPWAKGKRIVVVGDADEPGQDGKKQSAAAYHEAGAAEVLLGQLPYPITKDHGQDFRDFLLEGKTIADLPTVAVTAEQAAEWSRGDTKKRSDGGREIIIGTDESRVIDEAIDALATRDNAYQRGGKPHLRSGPSKQRSRRMAKRNRKPTKIVKQAASEQRPAGGRVLDWEDPAKVRAMLFGRGNTSSESKPDSPYDDPAFARLVLLCGAKTVPPVHVVESRPFTPPANDISLTGY